MSNGRRSLVVLAFGALLAAAPLAAALAQERPAAAHEAKPAPPGPSLPADVTSNFTLNVGGRNLAFKATAGSIRLNDDNGALQAEVAYVAYRLDGADVAKRPVTFAINGGPGAASAWLQLGAIGPWRLPMQNLSPSAPPVLADNAETWLDFTDLVFIDPPGTGYSKITGGDGARKRFWSLEGDVEALSVVIRRWLAANERLASPKFIVGESYGGFRGPRLAERLASDDGVGVSGLILISPVLDFGSFEDALNNPFPLLTRLPSYAAAHRERSGPVSRSDVADVERYAVGDYLADWLRGPRDQAAVERREQRVAALTGMDPATVRRLGGAIDKDAFLREFERSQGKIVAFYDATIAAYDPFPTAYRDNALDPILPGYEGPFTSAIVDLYARKLGWKLEERYELLNGEVDRNWNWGSRLNPPESITALRRMLALDPHFHVLVSHGLTDVQTPYLATQLQLDQIPDYGPQGRLILKVYPGGHMHYSRDDTRKAMRDDARRLIERDEGAEP
ncbi:MAG: peptidase S10 [Hyphomicrobiales bacterium]|nr:peptidase S10 [Hyphomicrobiales bacterium]